MPINYGSQRDDRTVSEHAAPGIQHQYRDDRSEQALDAGTRMCAYGCGRTEERCREEPCGLAVATEQPGRHCATCSCP